MKKIEIKDYVTGRGTSHEQVELWANDRLQSLKEEGIQNVEIVLTPTGQGYALSLIYNV